MTKVNVTFEAPENKFRVELDAQSQVAYDHWVATGDGDLSSGAWDNFLDEFERQMRPYMGTGGCIQEVYEEGVDE